MPSAPTERKLAAILSADVVGYSRLMAEDEDATVRALTDHRDAIAALVGQHRGRVVDAPGDNVLAEFPAATDAVQCAVEIQRVLEVRNAPLPGDRRMQFRIGVHLGEVRAEGERIYGDGVNIAARLEGLAEPGGICISGAVHDQVQSKLDLRSEDLGEQSVKNIPKPVRVFRVTIEAETALPEKRSKSPRRAALAVGVVVFLGAVVVVGWRMFAGDGEVTGAAISSPIRSIAVLPLENLSGDPEQEYFADGMTEALIGDLAKIGSLRVISRTSVMQYKEARKPLPEIARELNVEGIIEGTVMRDGDRVRITAQLIDARDDRHLWADRYDRDLRSILALQSELARAIATRFGAPGRSRSPRSLPQGAVPQRQVHDRRRVQGGRVLQPGNRAGPGVRSSLRRPQSVVCVPWNRPRGGSDRGCAASSEGGGAEGSGDR
jgi:TolB-like protein/class 3 adenylate cyclase